jgi:hypothetical protein
LPEPGPLASLDEQRGRASRGTAEGRETASEVTSLRIAPLCSMRLTEASVRCDSSTLYVRTCEAKATLAVENGGAESIPVRLSKLAAQFIRLMRLTRCFPLHRSSQKYSSYISSLVSRRMSSQDELKRRVAEAAIALVVPTLRPESYLGVGTGSTANFFIDLLAPHKNKYLSILFLLSLPSLPAVRRSSSISLLSLSFSGFSSLVSQDGSIYELIAVNT